MMQSRRREKAMLATVSRLRRLLRKADLATKRVRVMGVTIFYTAALSLGGGQPGCRSSSSETNYSTSKFIH